MTTVAPPADPAQRTTTLVERAVATGRSTPAQYRLLSVVCVVALAVAALVAFLAARSLTDATDRARSNTGPVLVATQDVFASIAEADAASAAVFLSGTDEDREQRRLYEVAQVEATAAAVTSQPRAESSSASALVTPGRYPVAGSGSAGSGGALGV